MIKTQEKYDIRSYFEQYTDFENKKILDFGCAYGSFLNFKQHNDYTGLDVRPWCIEKNNHTLPQHTWLYRDLFNHMYNPSGRQKLTLPSTYDVCVSFSVLTHMKIDDITETVGILKQHCDNLYLTYYSNKDKFAYETICEFRDLPSTQWEQIEKNNFFYIETDEWLWTFLDDDYIEGKLGAKSMKTKFPKDDYRGLQRCLVI